MFFISITEPALCLVGCCHYWPRKNELKLSLAAFNNGNRNFVFMTCSDGTLKKHLKFQAVIFIQVKLYSFCNGKRRIIHEDGQWPHLNY